MSHQPLTELMPLERIHTVAPDMSKTHKKIAEYILENYESASFLTSVALAQKCGVSESSVIRFSMFYGNAAGLAGCDPQSAVHAEASGAGLLANVRQQQHP